MRLLGVQVIGMQVVLYDHPQDYEHLLPREVEMVVMRKTPTCGRTDDCDCDCDCGCDYDCYWGSVSVGIVSPVWAFVRPEVAPTAS